MRQYQPIWERIKTHNHAALLAPIHNHERIKKMVIKEKCMDEGYKFLLSEKSLTSILIIATHPDKPEMLQFSLEHKILDKNIGVNDI